MGLRAWLVGLFGSVAAVALASSCGDVNVVGACGGDECAEGQCCLSTCGGVDASDQCIDVPEACGEIYAPVCGCDGVSYDSACVAHAGCVAVAHDGPCHAEACGGDVCAEGQCCMTTCGGNDVEDTCLTPPQSCAQIFSPVCGCNGETFGNACEAHAACVAVAYDGPCEGETCGGDVCGEGQCCLESCGGLDAATTCFDEPEACPDVFSPVCGCDGVTYGNACEAHAACAAIFYDGECAPTCDYEDPDAEGLCALGTVECPVGGPLIQCVPPEQYASCCCEQCD